MRYIVTFFLCLLFISLANAQVPNKISYQGLLTTSSGTPVTDGNYNLKFDIYNLPTGGSLRHTETHTAVALSKGTFSVVLGPFTQIFSESLYVEVTALSGPGISGPLTFSPRSELTSAPYALHAKLADTADYARNVPTNQGITNCILCQQIGSITGGMGGYTFNFSAPDCGGTLPDSTYIGVGVIFDICGGLITWRIHQAPTPGVTIYSQGGPCGSYHFAVLYIRTQ
jgi:hypothetical protein